jgi:hypothetical protein
MQKRSKVFLSMAGTVMLGGAVGTAALVGQRHAPARTPPSESETTAASPPSSRNAEAAPKAVPLAATAIAVPRSIPAAKALPRDERSLMAKLHELGETNPPVSLELAKEGNDRFPDSADAPERSWILVKSLVNMGRFDEARAEAATMVKMYPETSWSQDVERHLLVAPLFASDGIDSEN